MQVVRHVSSVAAPDLRRSPGSWSGAGVLLTAPDNLASRAVLTRAGFVVTVEVEVDGVRELRFVRDLTVDEAASPADR